MDAKANAVTAWQAIGKTLRRAHRAYSGRLQEVVAGHGLTLAQYLHLRELWHRDGVTQNELSQMIGIEKASSTAVLDGLERKGLIRRVRNEKDRRKVNVYLTAAGEDARAVLPAAKTVARQATAGLSQDDVDRLLVLLETIIANVDREADAAAGGPPRAMEDSPR